PPCQPPHPTHRSTALAATDIKIVPRNVHSPEERRSRVVVGPARLAVGRALVENAEMSPAIRVRRSGRFIPTEALTAAGNVQPDGEPSVSGLVIQSNRITQGIGKRALTAGGSDAGECGAAVVGERCAGDVDRVGVAAS